MNYWWLNANKDNWNWIKNQNVNEVEKWNAKNKNGKIKKYFKMIKKGDKVLGYNAKNTKAIVSLATIEKGIDESSNSSYIEIKKDFDLSIPIHLEEIKKITPFNIKFDNPIKLRGTAIKLEEDEYEKIISLIKTPYFLDGCYEVEIVSILGAEEEKIEEKPIKKSALKESWKRNPKHSKEALKNANYLCELDPKHITFISGVNQNNFVEAHHLIPMKEQDGFENSLDVSGNIVSLCPNCHRLIHFGESNIRVSSIEKLYKRKKEKLVKYGINIELKDLKNFYK